MPASRFRVPRGPVGIPRWCNPIWTLWVSSRRKKRMKFLDNTCSWIPAPENQLQSSCCILSDMFSLGLVICAIFNHGRPLIQSNNSTSAYLKQLELVKATTNWLFSNDDVKEPHSMSFLFLYPLQLDDGVHNMLPRIPIPLQEATSRLIR